MDDAGGSVDLFGNPNLPLRERRGRPSYAKNVENQQLVVTLRGGGQTQADIAVVLGCDEKTLRKYYSRELQHGAVLMEARMLQVLDHRARNGHVGAAKQLLDRARIRPGSEKIRTEPLGKKAQQLIDANRPPPGVDELLERTQRLVN